MTRCASQFFFFATLGLLLVPNTSAGGLITHEIYALKLVDLDGRTLLTNDGHVTVVVLTTRTAIAKAQLVGARVPDYCLGNPEYRMITVMSFGRNYGTVARALATALIRHRINIDAAQLQRRYDARGVHKDARQDVFVVADFDGTISQRLGAGPDAAAFRVFVFGRDGELLREWENVPGAEELVAVVR